MQDRSAGLRVEWQRATITGISRQSARVSSFFFAPSKPFVYEAGQHVDVRLTAPDGYQAQRSYSIASAPESGASIELAVERLDDGEVSAFFHDIAQIGDEIELRGPIGGHFIWTVADGGPIFLVGGGSGVVPLVSMVRHRQARASTTPFLLLYSARTFDEIIFREELLDLAAKASGFSLALALTREMVQREGHYTRRIDASIVTQTLTRLPAPPKQTFVCGSNAFVTAATDALTAAGILAGSIRVERYGV
ncbi:MAG: ferredoxin reductase [Phyllobacterium sp.]|uniref:ferredoxin reductase n=1 Tax=Phyllobacterium sp. TaxID=1871046 RepID=UPI0030F32DFD